MYFELTGKITEVLPTQRGQGRSGEWVSNSFVVQYGEQGHIQQLCLTVFGEDKWQKISQNVAVGNTVHCLFNLSSKGYNGKYFTSAVCFSCSLGGYSNNQGGGNGYQQQPQPQQPEYADPF